MIPTLEDIIRGLLSGTMTREAAERYLELHVELQNDLESLVEPSYERAQAIIDTIKKCHEQDRRWGQRVYPDFNLGMMNSADTSIAGLANTHGVLAPDKARWLTQTRDGDGELSWMDILSEEVSKLCEKYESPVELRAQLIDVAGVAVQWASQLSAMTVTIEAPDHEGPGDEPNDPA